MQSTQRATLPANHVMALFSDRALSFSLSPDATFGDLADHLDKRHEGLLPVAIYLKFATTRKPVSTFRPASLYG
jgi:hypothetical protein